MGYSSNSPKQGYISIENLIIKNDNIAYSVNNLYTKSKYIYWNKNNPYTIFESDIRNSDLGFLIIRNSNGICSLVKDINIETIFDGVNTDILNNKINNIGLRANQQKKELININKGVNNLSEEYNYDKDFSYKKENFNISIIRFNGLLISLNSILIDYLSDNIFSEYEKNDIKIKFKEVEDNWEISLQYANDLMEIVTEEDNERNKDKLNDAGISIGLISTYMSNLKKNIESHIEKSGDEKISINEVNLIQTIIENLLTNIEDLKNTCDNMTFLGSGGTISTQVTDTNLRIDYLVNKFSQLQQSLINSYDDERIEIQKCINNLIVLGNKILAVIKEIYSKDRNNISKESRNYIGQYITSSQSNINRLKGYYENYYSNTTISNEYKKELKESFDLLENKFNKLKTAVMTNLNDGVLSTNDYNNFCGVLYEYRDAYNTLSSKLLSCITIINNGSITTSLNQLKKDITKEYQEAISNMQKNINLTINNLEKRISDLEKGVTINE